MLHRQGHWRSHTAQKAIAMLYICAGTLLNLLRYQFIRYGDIYSLHTADQKIKHIPFRRGVLAPRQRRLGRHPPAHPGRSRQRCCPRCSSLPALMLLAMGRPCNRPGRVAQYIFPQPEQPELGRIFIRKTQALADDAHHCLFGNAAVDPISAVEAVQQLRPRRLHVAPRFVAETDPALGDCPHHLLPKPYLSTWTWKAVRKIQTMKSERARPRAVTRSRLSAAIFVAPARRPQQWSPFSRFGPEQQQWAKRTECHWSSLRRALLRLDVDLGDGEAVAARFLSAWRPSEGSGVYALANFAGFC